VGACPIWNQLTNQSWNLLNNTQSHKTKMMNEQVMTSFIEWAERVEKLTQENSLINSRDILHDVFGMLQNDEHFLPRL
jgi:hypothetical protein